MSDRPPAAEVRLRAVEDTDLPTILAHQDDPVAAAMAAFPTRDPQAFLVHWAKIRADPTVVTRTIVAEAALLLDEVPDRPILARAAEHNMGSRRVLEHCGFVHIGETDADGIHELTYRLD